MLRYRILAVHNHCQSFTIVGFVEGCMSAHQHVQDDPKRPHVHSRGVIAVTQQDLRGGVGEAAAGRLQLLAGTELVAESKVGELNDSKFLEENNILGFEVSVYYV